MIKGKLKSIKRVVAVALAGGALVAVAGDTPASAEVTCGSCTPWWHLSSGSLPRNLPPGGEGKISVLAEDLGDAGVSSSVVLRDRLPAGLTAQSVELGLGVLGTISPSFGEFFCSVLPDEVTCTVPEEITALFLGTAYSHIEIYIKVKVAETAKSGEENRASVAGGGAPNASAGRPITVSSAPTPFGIEQYEMTAENADGSLDTQAGSHPFQLTTAEALNQTADPLKPPAAVKDLRFNLPPGLIGNPTPFPQCPLTKFIGNAETRTEFLSGRHGGRDRVGDVHVPGW